MVVVVVVAVLEVSAPAPLVHTAFPDLEKPQQPEQQDIQTSFCFCINKDL